MMSLSVTVAETCVQEPSVGTGAANEPVTSAPRVAQLLEFRPNYSLHKYVYINMYRMVLFCR